MLTLRIKQKCCFDDLVSGKQKEVYEEKTPANEIQFANLWGKDSAAWKNPQYVTFEIGEEPRKRTLVALCALALGEGYPEWGAEKGVVYFILKVQKIVEVSEPLEMAEEVDEDVVEEITEETTEEVAEEVTEEVAEETVEEAAEEVSEEVETEPEEVETEDEQEQIEVQVLGECAIAAEQIEEEPLDVTMDSDGPVEEEADTMATETVGEELNEAESINRERVSAD